MYKIGQRFQDEEYGGVYILAQVGASLIALISLADGNRYADPVYAELGCKNISDKEFERISACTPFYRLR